MYLGLSPLVPGKFIQCIELQEIVHSLGVLLCSRLRCETKRGAENGSFLAVFRTS